MLKKLLRANWHLKSTTLILILAAFFTLSYNYYFFSTVVARLNLFSPMDIFLGISLVLCLIATMNLLLNFLFWPYVYKPIFCLLIIIASITSYFTTFDHISFSPGMISDIINGTTGEASELISTPLVLWVLCLGVLPAILLLKTQIQLQPWGKEVVYRVTSFLISLAVILSLLIPLLGTYQKLASPRAFFKYNFNPVNFIQGSIIVLQNYENSKMPFKHIGVDAHKAPSWAIVTRKL